MLPGAQIKYTISAVMIAPISVKIRVYFNARFFIECGLVVNRNRLLYRLI